MDWSSSYLHTCIFLCTIVNTQRPLWPEPLIYSIMNISSFFIRECAWIKEVCGILHLRISWAWLVTVLQNNQRKRFQCTKQNMLKPPSGTRVHAKCNSVLHSARPRVLHSAGGPYITCLAKWMDEGFAGTQLYRQRVSFFLPLSLLTLDQHNKCKFV
jgi:hypothetical protein